MRRHKRATLTLFMFFIITGITSIARADVGQINQVVPAAPERGNVVTLIGGGFGDPFGKQVIMSRIMGGQIQPDFYTMRVTLWTTDKIKALVPLNIPPAEGYVVYLSVAGGQTFSNWISVDIRSSTIPRWRLGSGEIIRNRCESSRTENGGPYPPCATMSRIDGVDDRRAFPGGRILINGDFSNMQDGQVVGLIRTDYVYTIELGRSIHRNFVHHFLQVIRWSPNQIEVGVPNDVYPATFELSIVNRFPEFTGDSMGIFEMGSNGWRVPIQNMWR